MAGLPKPRSVDIELAIRIVDRSGVVDWLSPYLDSNVGRRRSVSLHGFFVAYVLNGLQAKHDAHMASIARTLYALPANQLRDLGCDPGEFGPHLYKVVAYLSNKLSALVDPDQDAATETPDTGDGEPTPTAAAILTRLVKASYPASFAPTAVAVDGTAVETAARLQGGNGRVRVDGEAKESSPELLDEDGNPTGGQKQPRSTALGVGPDGRKQHTADPDARAGYRTGTDGRDGALYVGYELHLIVGASAEPAGSHRGEAVVGPILDHLEDNPNLQEVVVDGGYSLAKPSRFANHLRAAGLDIVYKAASHQLGPKPLRDDTFLLNGHPESETLPERLRNLPLAPIDASNAEREAFEEPYNRAARYRYTQHGKPGPNGTVRYRSPIDAGRLRDRNTPATMRQSRTKPLVDSSPFGIHQATFRATLDELPLYSPYMTGTTAHRVPYNSRRQIVESVNAGLKDGTFVDIENGCCRRFETHNTRLALAATLVGCNIRELRRTARDQRYVAAIESLRILDDRTDEPLLTLALDTHDHATDRTIGRDPPG